LANIIAHQMGVSLKITSGPAIERAGDLAAILTNLRRGDVLFIDEIHRLGRAVEEVLYPAMEDYALDIVIGKGPSARNIRLKLPHFTVLGATTRLDLLAAPLRDRFGAVFRLEFYTPDELQQIVTRSAAILKVPVETDGAREIAARSRGTARIANRLLKRARDFAQVRADGVITRSVAQEALALMNVDSLGLDDLDNKVLRSIIEKFGGGPVGRNDRRQHQRGKQHDYGRGRTVPPATGLPGSYPTRPGGDSPRLPTPGFDSTGATGAAVVVLKDSSAGKLPSTYPLIRMLAAKRTL
jgi:Holliday junction DNA helicase RuvB